MIISVWLFGKQVIAVELGGSTAEPEVTQSIGFAAGEIADPPWQETAGFCATPRRTP